MLLHTHIALNMLTALTWYSLEHMHTHVVCERPASYPGQAILRPGNFPGPCSPDLLTTAWQEPRPQLCHPVPLGITLVLTLSAPVGPWSLVCAGHAVDLLLPGDGCGWAGSVLKGAREMWQGAGGPHAVFFPGRGHAAVPEQGGVHQSRKGPRPGDWGLPPKSGVTSPPCISCRQTD